MKTKGLNSWVLYIGVAFLMSSCAIASRNTRLPETLGEMNTVYSYIPLDPLPVFEEAGRSCLEEDDSPTFKGLLESLPDQAVRLAIAQFDASGSVTYGPVAVGYKNNSYQVILDYISVDATHLPIYIKRVITSGPENGTEVSVFDESITSPTRYITEAAPRINPYDDSNSNFLTDSTKGELVVVPVYIGVGLRLTASIFVQKGEVNLSSLGAIAAEAEAGKLTGTLTVQTLGITGDNVSTILPLPSEINQTTIQNAILALGSIKAVLHDQENTIISPRVVGIYNPIGGGQDITNGIISRLAEQPIRWYRPCKGN
jgi:hypothetical protein